MEPDFLQFANLHGIKHVIKDTAMGLGSSPCVLKAFKPALEASPTMCMYWRRFSQGLPLHTSRLSCQHCRSGTAKVESSTSRSHPSVADIAWNSLLVYKGAMSTAGATNINNPAIRILASFVLLIDGAGSPCFTSHMTLSQLLDYARSQRQLLPISVGAPYLQSC